MVVDGTDVYWVNYGADGYDETVNKVRLGGGRVITFATGQTYDSVALGP